MRQVISGSGADTTAAVAQWLKTSNQLQLATLYLIGEPESDASLWLTEWGTPLDWPWWGTFQPAVIKRGPVKSQIGLEVATLDVEWTPGDQQFVADSKFTSPYQRAILGAYDGATFRCWTAYMPKPGDCNTFGASELFGGRVGNAVVAQGSIKFTVNSFLDVVNQMVPGSVIESSNSAAGFQGACGPGGSRPAPTFTVTAGSNTQLFGNGASFALDDFVDGYVFFTSGSLKGIWSVVVGNTRTHLGSTTFTLAQPLPWPPAAGDTFYASATFPNTQGSSGYYGFPFVPAPEQAV